MMKNNIHFKKASPAHQDFIFAWLEEPHMKEFWDNSQEHKDDILNFMKGQKQHYFYGTFRYWVGFLEDQPYSFILSDQVHAHEEDLPGLWRTHLSKTGHTIAIDFGIGNKSFLGKGFAAPTLSAFIEFYKTQIDPQADTFFIDPDENNPRAKHVYEKAGFELVGEYQPTQGAFQNQTSYLMVKKAL